MKTRQYPQAITLISLLLCLGGCGGGGSATIPPIQLPPPPADPSALPVGELIVFGPIPASGEFRIADVSFDTGSAEVVVNDQPAQRSMLRPGHIIAMVGDTAADGNVTARELMLEANLIGNVDSINVTESKAVVMGQTIEITGDSILTESLQNFSVGEVVQVSGYTNSDGVTVASRIDYSVDNRELRLIGRVASLDPVNFRFAINALDVDYSQAVMINTPNGEVQPDMEVLITGGRSASGTFQAQSVTHFDRDISDLAGAHFRAQGLITAARSADDFSINGFPVVMGGQRDYRQGSADDIVVGAEIRIEGNILGDGAPEVHRVWFLPE